MGILLHLLFFAVAALGALVCCGALLILDKEFEELPEPAQEPAAEPADAPESIVSVTPLPA